MVTRHIVHARTAFGEEIQYIVDRRAAVQGLVVRITDIS